MVDVFFYEAFAEEAAVLRQLLPVNYSAGYTDRTIQEAGHDEPPARLISIRTQSKLPLDWGPKLDAIVSRSTGYDHLSAYVASVTQCPALGYLPLYCHRAVAEQAILLALALLRKLPRQVGQFRQFNRDGLTGSECQGRTLLVVGVGHIGLEVCQIGLALGMRVRGVDLVRRHAELTYVDIDAALTESDVIVCRDGFEPVEPRLFQRASLEAN